MTLEQLRIFVAVAEREHMTAAARALNVTQSAASAAIAALEARHGVHLFDRVGRGIGLTDAGRLFLEEARAVLARATAAEQALDDMAGLRRGRLSLVASQTTSAYWLPPVLAAFRARHPQVTIDLAIGNTEQAAEKVRDGDAELGIVEGEIDDPALGVWPIAEDRLFLVQNAPSANFDAAALRAARWVMREPGSGTRSVLDEALRRIGIDPGALDISLVLPSNESVRTAVEHGAGIAALSALVVAPAIAAGRLHALPVDLGTRPFYGVRHKARYRSQAVEAFLKLVGEGGVWA
jgi:DNA-binding transcriptional LysR family regulator